MLNINNYGNHNFSTKKKKCEQLILKTKPCIIYMPGLK